ncbi:MAG TPA: agmatinase, partial [Methylomirabilota bacterium]|nr:agmatinase [Methylomirabilota bacterium]
GARGQGLARSAFANPWPLAPVQRMRPQSPAFIAATSPAEDAAVLIFGIPFEGNVNLRKGAHRGPNAIRVASDSIETYSPVLVRDLLDLPIADLGNCHLPGGDPETQLASVAAQIEAELPAGRPTVMLGGDHTATVPVVKHYLRRFPSLRVVQFDAHTDLRPEFLGARFNYASAMARLLEWLPPDHLYQIGPRSGTREEFESRHTRLYPAHEIHPLDALRRTLPELAGCPVYVTIDIDVLDPSEAPGTGSPEPGGLRATELAEALRLLAGCELVGMDLTEVSPPWDPSGRTPILAAWLIREAMLAWWGK